MPDSTPTSRRVGDHTVPGIQRLVFVHDEGRYILTPLAVFADGTVIWWFNGGTDLDGLRAAFADGTLTLAPPDDSPVLVAGTATGWVTAFESWLTPEQVIGDLADEVDRLNDRPDSSRRCWNALLTYAADPIAANLEIVRERYHAVPEHRRRFLLGDMDQNDVPVRTLLAEQGETIPARDAGQTITVTPEARERALDYFRRSSRAIDDSGTRATADGPETAAEIRVGRFVHPGPDSDPSGLVMLQNDYPATVVHAGREYRSVEHAYWALSTDDPEWRDRIAGALHGYQAEAIGQDAPRRDNWPAIRLAVAAALLRDKFDRHPAIAATLLGTGDARIRHDRTGSRFWRGDGANWSGRLLELVRSELAAR